MNQEFNLERYLTGGVEQIVKGALRATLKDPKESLFLAKYAIASREASKLRHQFEEQGLHIPPFLIASITSSCNLHCKGCYARANHQCVDGPEQNSLSAKEWSKIFQEAKSLGIGFILLAGGEPMLRQDVMEAAARVPEILFPVFTNATLIDADCLNLLDKSRNLVPVISIEGGSETTDERRGNGTYLKIQEAMARMKQNHLIFGASVTVTTENIREVTSPEFLQKLELSGCKVVFFVEYVPMDESTSDLAPQDAEREYLTDCLDELRKGNGSMVYISFPGDEKTSGGCLAAGRGFFHINPQGGAEPCPFSPYSDINVRDTSIREALESRLFRSLQEEGLLMEDHAGGCVLFERKERVEELLA